MYYCEEVKGEEATMYMLESYQHGRFVQVVFKATMDNLRSYVEVTDSHDLRRLQWRLSHFRDLHSASTSANGRNGDPHA